MKMLKANFELALRRAIQAEKQATGGSSSKSAFLAGLEQVLEASQCGERIEITNG